MHCPNCGKPADADQQFCRACGMSLETVGKLVAEHSSIPQPQQRSDKAEREREIVHKMFNWIIWGMIIMGLGIVMLLVNKSFNIGEALKFASTLMILGGAGVAAGGTLSAMKQGAAISSKKPLDQISGSVDTKSLPTKPFPASLPSVTERTTNLLPTDEARVNNVIGSNRRE
jgi:hypothetical protein